MSNFNNNSNISIYLQKLVMQILEKNGLLKGNKMFGVIEEIISETVVKVYIEMLKEQLKSTMVLTGCPSVKETSMHLISVPKSSW